MSSQMYYTFAFLIKYNIIDLLKIIAVLCHKPEPVSTQYLSYLPQPIKRYRISSNVKLRQNNNVHLSAT